MTTDQKLDAATVLSLLNGVTEKVETIHTDLKRG